MLIDFPEGVRKSEGGGEATFEALAQRERIKSPNEIERREEQNETETRCLATL